MKASLSHLQFENEQLKTEVAKLKEENRSMDDRLVQEQMHNGDLAARLDDARNLLRDRGIDSETRVGARSRGTRSGDPDEELSQPRTLPAGRTSKKPRKPPAASIPGDLDDLPTASDREDPKAARSRSGTTPHPCASRSSRIPIPKSSPTTISFAGNPWPVTRPGPLRGSESPPATPPCPTEERGEQSGVGLKEAKDAIEAFIDSLHQ